MKDTFKRSVLKTIVFKIITTSITAIFLGWKGAILLHLLLTLVYLLHERLWNMIKWGKTKSNEVLHHEQKGYVYNEQIIP